MSVADKIEILQGDLTEMETDAIVNAANNDLQLGGSTTAKALRSSTAHSLHLAKEKGLKSIAFPAVGTGIAGFPMRECAEIMLDEAVKHFSGATSLQKVYFVLFDKPAAGTFRQVWDEMRKKATT